MKKINLNKAVILIPVWLCFSAWLGAKNIDICPACRLNSIKKAVEMASPGDKLLIHSGLYKERNILINKPLVLEGLGRPVIDGEGAGEILIVASDRVAIRGLQLQNVGLSYTEDRAGIRVKNARDFEIRNNKLINTFFGIYLAYAKNGIVANNELYADAKDEISSGNGIHLWYCKNILIQKNRVTGHRDGIYFEFADSCKIIQNHSEKNIRYGLHFMFSNDDSYSKNVFLDNGAGVAVMFSRRIEMFDNQFQKNWGGASYGMLLKEIYDAQIYRNLFLENTIGIHLEGATRIKYFDNQFKNNGWALKITGGCVENSFTRNQFIGNSFDLSIQSEGIQNSFDGNYWSEYSGYDLDRDGVGDVPYRPVKLISYMVNQTPEALVLIRSFFVDILNFSEKVSPVFTPANVLDNAPFIYPDCKKRTFPKK